MALKILDEEWCVCHRKALVEEVKEVWRMDWRGARAKWGVEQLGAAAVTQVRGDSK